MCRVCEGNIEKLETSNQQQTQTSSKDNQQISYYQNKDIESFIESSYVSIKDRETKVLEFLADRTKVVDKTDFNGKPTKRVQFIVIDINDPQHKEKTFEVSRMHVAKIYEELKKGRTVLEISRIGSNKDTRYFIKPVR
jgi:hypothetical protein